MDPNISMVIRYAITAVVAFAVGKGWVSAPAQGPLVDGVVQLVGVLVAAVPPIYAAMKIDNRPKT